MLTYTNQSYLLVFFLLFVIQNKIWDIAKYSYNIFLSCYLLKSYETEYSGINILGTLNKEN